MDQNIWFHQWAAGKHDPVGGTVAPPHLALVRPVRQTMAKSPTTSPEWAVVPTSAICVAAPAPLPLTS